MKAWVHRIDDESGRDILGTGVDAGHITPNYASLDSMRINWLQNLPTGNYHVEAYHDWERRFGKADIDFIYTNNK